MNCVNFFTAMNSAVGINYRVNNKCICIQVRFDKSSQWNANQDKKTLWKLVEKYKLDLIGYDNHTIRFTKCVSFWSKKKIVCDYTILLNPLKFDINVFLFSKEYQSTQKVFSIKLNCFKRNGNRKFNSHIWQITGKHR